MIRLLALIFVLFLPSEANSAIPNAHRILGYNVARQQLCNFPLPIGSNTVIGAYSFRKLYADYSGYALELIRASDSSTMNIGFSGCDFDSDTASTFCNGTTCRIKMYDQSGNNVDQTNTSVSNRPVLSLNCINGKPCALGNSTYNIRGSLPSSVTSNSQITAVKFSVLTTAWPSFVYSNSQNGSGVGYSATSSACVDFRIISNTAYKATKPCSTGVRYVLFGTNTDTLSRIYLNGEKGTDNTSSITLPTAPYTALMGGSVSYNSIQGEVYESILFAPNISDSDGLQITANMRSYWGF